MAQTNLQNRNRRRKLGLIALECCIPILLLAYLPRHVLNNLMERDPEAAKRHPGLAAYGNAELAARDTLETMGRSADLDPRIVFLTIDSESTSLDDLLAEERETLLREVPALQLMSAGFPWDRRVYALVIERLVQAGAKVVTFDMRFPSEKPEDAEVRPILERYRSALVVGSNLEWIDAGQGQSPHLELPSSSLLGTAQEPETLPGDDRTGFVNFQPDADGLVRRAIFRTNLVEYFYAGTTEEGGTELYSLAARTAVKAGAGYAIPPTHQPTMFRFIERDKLIRNRVSLHSIFVPALWEKNYQSGAFFKDKIVFVGPFANWVKESNDVQKTPFGDTLGPQIHISALNAILSSDFLFEPPWWLNVPLVLAAGLMAWIAGITVEAPRRRLLVLITMNALYIGAAFLIYNESGLCLSLLSPTLALLSSGVVGLVWERVVEGKEKERVRKTLERYVSKDVVKEVLDNPESFLHAAGGERRPLTILFFDVRGFTTITESADATALVTQLNEYFTEMVRIVFAHKGTVDKFIGDAVMAHWGGITTRGKGPDACRAVAAALDMIKALGPLNANWKSRGMEEFHVGFGVNHGEAICANIGSEEKHEFTAIGDPVNLASRLEGATKQFRQKLLIGEQVAALVQEQYVLRSVDLLQVKGKTRPVEIFAVVSPRNGSVPDWLTAHEEGVRLFRQRSFAEAATSFEAALKGLPDDFLAQEYLRRSREYAEVPPPPDWDGVFVMTRK